MVDMGEYEKMAKSYGINVDGAKGLQILSISTIPRVGVDVGFVGDGGGILGDYFSSFKRYEIYRKLSIYGNCAKFLAEILREDLSFCSSLYVLFNYAYSARWTGSEFVININALARGYPHNESDGGEQIFLAIKNLVDRLNAIDFEKINGLGSVSNGFGPTKLRGLMLKIAGALPVAFVLIIGLIFVPKLMLHR